MTSIKDHLKQLGYQKLHDEVFITRDQAAQTIAASGLILPPDYVDFLRAYPNSGYFECEIGHFDCEVVSPGPASNGSSDGQYALDTLTGLDEEQGPLFLPAWSLPAHYLPIAGTFGSACFVMDLRPATSGRVLYYAEDGTEESGLLPLADSFSAFILGLRHVENEEPAPEKPGLFKRLFNKFSN